MRYKGQTVQCFSENAVGDSTYLISREIPRLLHRYVTTGKKALDYGCGVGLRIPLLQEAGLNIEGVDIEPEMLEQARTQYPDLTFTEIQSAQVPQADETYDLVFICFVLLEMGDFEEIQKIIKEAFRLLKPNGTLMVISNTDAAFSASNNFHIYQLISSDPQPPKNGHVYKMQVLNRDFIFEDFFWSQETYLQAFEQAGFILAEHCLPLGRADEGINWQDELHTAPQTIYVLKKP